MSHDQVRLNAVVDRSPINEGKYGDQMKPGFFWNGSVCDWLGGLSGDRQLLLGLGEGAKPTRDSTGTNRKYIGRWFDPKGKTSVQTTTTTHGIHYNEVYFYRPFPVLSHFRTRSPLLRATSITFILD